MSWETKREKLINILKLEGEINVRSVYYELEYSTKRKLVDDLIHVAKTLKHKGIKLKIIPASCSLCGFVFKQKINSFKIPSKCPNCNGTPRGAGRGLRDRGHRYLCIRPE